MLERAIAGVDGSPGFRRLLRLPLQQPGKALASAGQPRWPALVLACASAAGGSDAAAAQAAAAVEAFIAAADVFDELEDGDCSPLIAEAGPAQALNAASALLLLSQALIATLDDAGVAPRHISSLQRLLPRAGLAAAAGQYRDLALEGRHETTLADAIEIARGKAGALAAGAARLGAALGTADDGLLECYATLGRHYGTMAQLANDLHDAYDGPAKTDHQRAKQTLPLVFARSDPRGTPGDALVLSGNEVEASGALHFTWVVIEMERQRARLVLAELAARGQRIEALEALVG